MAEDFASGSFESIIVKKMYDFYSTNVAARF